jgi:uncharacterized protein YndB with AHSA1/START domain
MAHTSIHADVPPAAVWEVLSDPRLYGNWVVGASTIREVEGDWPAVGAVLHHIQMRVLRDTTTVLESEPPRRIVLEARARPLVVARVALTLTEEDGGTRIDMEETAESGLAAAMPAPIVDGLIHVRNRETMVRLKRLAEIGARLGRTTPGGP